MHDLTGQFQGVVATDVSLKGLQTFIETLPLSEGSHALILQKDGTLIASSTGYNLAANPTDQLQLVSIKTSQDPLLAAIYRALNSPHTSHTLKDANGDYDEVAYRALNEHSGLDWVAVVVVPHNVMLAGIRLHVVLVVGLGLLALGTTLALGLRIFGSVANDMKTLTQAVRKVVMVTSIRPFALLVTMKLANWPKIFIACVTAFLPMRSRAAPIAVH